MNYESIFFDLDGTLTDPYIGITNSILFSLEYYPEIAKPQREALKPFIGPPLYASYMEFFGMDEPTACEAVEHYREYYRPKGVLECSLYDGITELLKNLKASGKKVYLATSKPEGFATQILEHFEIKQYFDGIYGSTLDGSRVKKEDVLAYALAESKSDPRLSVMIGDTVFDVTGALQNGLPCIGVSYGYGEKTKLSKAGAISVAHSANELKTLLLK